MALLQMALDYVLRNEDVTRSGLITREPKGGYARFGINSRAHPEAERAGFYEMPCDQALAYALNLYADCYFVPIGGAHIADQSIANKFFDLAVNLGIVPATKILQGAVNSLLDPEKQPLAVDGRAGLRTIDAINQSMPGALMAAIHREAEARYRAIAKDPEEATYLDEWLRRLNA